MDGVAPWVAQAATIQQGAASPGAGTARFLEKGSELD